MPDLNGSGKSTAETGRGSIRRRGTSWSGKHGRELVKRNNVLLDPLPVSWEAEDGTEYPINTDFRIGIQMCMIQDDAELNDAEKARLLKEFLFYGSVPESADEISECTRFFLNGWFHDKNLKKTEHKRLMDFDVDQWRIYSAFLKQYGIDLNDVEYMHFWEFMGLLSNLEECAYTRVIDIRQRKISQKMDNEQKRALREAKEVYELAQARSQEEEETDNNLYDFLGGNLNYGEAEKKRVEEFESYADKGGGH